jgi:hypothetical protein
LTITPDKSYNIQIFKGNNWELTFERSDGIKLLSCGPDRKYLDLKTEAGQDKNQTRYCVKLKKDGKAFEATDLSEDLYNLFLSRITSGEIVETIEDLVILFSDLN